MTLPLAGPGNQVLLGEELADLNWPAIEPQSASITGQVVAGECLLSGFTFAETTGAAAATVDLFDGGGTGGQFIARIALTPGQSQRDLLPWPGVHCEVGLFVNVVAGTVLGAAWVVII